MVPRLRPVRNDDHEFLTDMLMEAANWQPDAVIDRAATLADVKAARYVQDWPREGDAGVIATDDREVRLGAAWFRLFPTDAPAYGFVAPDVPELAIGVLKAHRGKGIGRTLLRAALAMASDDGHARVCLGVDYGNPAERLYESEGFITVERRATARTMVWTAKHD